MDDEIRDHKTSQRAMDPGSPTCLQVVLGHALLDPVHAFLDPVHVLYRLHAAIRECQAVC
jgi:hypothetical protein